MIELDKWTELSFMQFLKADSLIETTELGKTIFSRLTHPLKAEFSIETTELGISIELSEEQSSKTDIPIMEIELDSFTFFKLLQE